MTDHAAPSETSRTMPETNIEVIRGLYDAFAAGDVPGVLKRLSPDIRWNEAENFPYADGNPYIGPDAVMKGVFARCIGEWKDFAVAIDEIHDAGDTIIATGRYTGTHTGTGRSLSAQVVHVYRVADGRAVAFQQYVDTLQVARVTGAV